MMLASARTNQEPGPLTPSASFQQPIADLIRARSSWRSYEPQPIAARLRGQLSDFIGEQSNGPFGSELRFTLVAATESDGDELRGLGTYGFIKNPAGFVVGAVKTSATGMEDYGYAMERMVLCATELGLATCWIGGSLRRSRFAARIGLARDETMPAIFSVGTRAERRGRVDRIIRWTAKSKKRKPWETRFFDESFDAPLAEPAAGRFATPLEMVRIAPSASNRQPWRVVRARQDGTLMFHFYVQRTPGYSRRLKTLRLADLQRVDMGIGMSHFDASAAAAGIDGRWVIRDPRLSAPELTEYIATYQQTR